ncbi:nucleotide pyrophosphohydrolase [Marinomonas sp. A3A]|uniref:nucleotide pyrophosphohydrolase n=1 Tax=Marinomonas sp. A3A TaxID=2065312 RepID=UPI001BB42D46|nr:nucleotide pyrophosphohydrolase [Marinomonas sp. A3A]QUX93305.1 nucleotide pyrophosphohydrolase [Marinomonas sp. A3A]
METKRIEHLIEKLRAFRDERDWAQFHNPKDLAIALNIETSELLEVFLWKDPEEANLEKVKEELADVFCYALLIADRFDLDVFDIVEKKIQLNAEKYPISQSKGSYKKYTDI